MGHHQIGVERKGNKNMNQNQTLQMAQKMVEATKTASTSQTKNGVFICTDPDKGQYDFIPLEDLALNGEPLGKLMQSLKMASKKQGAQLETIIKVKETLDSFINPSVVHSMAVLDISGHIIKIVPFQLALLAADEPIPEDIANGYYKVVDNHIVVDAARKEAYHSLD